MDKRTYETVISYIKSEILSGNLKQGKKLMPERELALLLGVSRTSVREALRTLEILGLIESIQGAGNYISGNFEKSITEVLSMMFLLQQTDTRQLSLVRETLELKAAELATVHITEPQIKELETILSKMALSKNEEAVAKLDKALHDTITRASDNVILIQILNAMSVLVDDFIKDIRHSILQKEENHLKLQIIHTDIVKAIQSGDVSATQKAFAAHSRIIEEHLGC